MFQKMMDKSVAKSPWLFHVNAGSCNGCDIEIVAALTPAMTRSVWASAWQASPRQADIVVVSGLSPARRVTESSVPSHRYPNPVSLSVLVPVPVPATFSRAAMPLTAPWKSGFM